MDAQAQLLTLIYSVFGLASIESIIIVLARRDVKLGLKKWWYTKRGMQPLKIRYHGADKHVREDIISMRGKGDKIDVEVLKGLPFLKKKVDGDTFFVEPDAIRICDDNMHEISYSYKSIMPLDPTQTAEETKAEQSRFVQRYNDMKKEDAAEKGKTFKPVPIEDVIKFTDPKRLNKFIDYNYLAAKADALKDAVDILKWVKWGTIAAVIGVVIGAVIYMKVNGEVLPILAEIKGMLTNVGTTVLHPGG